MHKYACMGGSSFSPLTFTHSNTASTAYFTTRRQSCTHPTPPHPTTHTHPHTHVHMQNTHTRTYTRAHAYAELFIDGQGHSNSVESRKEHTPMRSPPPSSIDPPLSLLLGVALGSAGSAAADPSAIWSTPPPSADWEALPVLASCASPCTHFLDQRSDINGRRFWDIIIINLSQTFADMGIAILLNLMLHRQRQDLEAESNDGARQQRCRAISYWKKFALQVKAKKGPRPGRPVPHIV